VAINQSLPITVAALAVGDRLCLQKTGRASCASGAGIGSITIFVTPS
jgi:hypothetical protein